MTHKPGKAAVAKHLVELRREAVATLKRFNMIAERLNLYKEYLALSETYDGQMAGPFLLIEGGQSQTEQAGIKETDSRSYLIMAGAHRDANSAGSTCRRWTRKLETIYRRMVCDCMLALSAQKHIPNR
jgi:hypothetical protein